MKHRRRFLFLWGSVALLVLAGLYIWALQLRRPPLKSLEKALHSITTARQENLKESSRELLINAERLLKRAEESILRENKRMTPLVTYREADSLLKEAAQMADKAIKTARETRSKAQLTQKSEITQLYDSLEVWRAELDEDLIHSDSEILYRHAKSLLSLALDYNSRGLDGDASLCTDSTLKVFSQLTETRIRLRRAVDLRARNASQWASKTIQQSKNSGGIAFLVDKSSHNLYVIKKGKIVDTIKCELGYNSTNQKKMSGDGATPEGMYKVIEVKKYSKYYKALLLDYPNASDRERFRKNKAAGIIPGDAKIGSLIEIHGNGGENRDWTDGCVAVTDRDMDRIMKLAVVGTPVTIIRFWDKAQ